MLPIFLPVLICTASIPKISKAGFQWIYEQCQIGSHMKILELGCGDGALWTQNLSLLPANISVTLSDLPPECFGTQDVLWAVKTTASPLRLSTVQKSLTKITSFDLVIADHVLFYCEDIPAVCREIHRVLVPGGKFVCSTYGSRHMQEVSQLVQDFDSRIVLSADKLYERFGRENGRQILSP